MPVDSCARSAGNLIGIEVVVPVEASRVRVELAQFIGLQPTD